jgi:hypothetical protein
MGAIDGSRFGGDGLADGVSATGATIGNVHRLFLLRLRAAGFIPAGPDGGG